MPAQPTGLQYLAQVIFPPLLQGMAGRWLLSKLFNVLRDRSLLPPTLDTWLKKPVPVEATLRQQIPGDVRKALVQALQMIEGEEDEELVAVSRKVTAAFVPEAGVSEDDVDDLLEDGFDFEGDRITIAALVSDTFEDYDDFDTGSSVRVATAVQSPDVSVYPKGISEKGKIIWDEMIEDFAVEITKLGQNNPEREWAAAILIYQRLCKDEGIRPFQRGVQRLRPHTGDTLLRRRRLIKRMNTAYKWGLRKMQSVTTILREVHKVKPASRMLLAADPVLRADGEFQMRMYYRFDMAGQNTHQRKLIRQNLSNTQGFGPGRRKNTLAYELTKYRYRLILEKHSKDEWHMYLSFPLSETEAIFLTGQRDKASILEGLKKLTREWRMQGQFPTETP